MKWILSFFLFLIIDSSCKQNESKYPYAIKDFSKTLRPHLHQIVSNGEIGISGSEIFLERNANNEELNNLSYCEHPLLRAVAIRALLKKDSINQNKLILSHLDDTAFIVSEISDWGRGFTGIDFSSIADDMIKHSSWKSFSDRQKIIDRVITKHNYLVSAYEIADRLQPEEKYYLSIKEMIKREREHKLILNVIIALSEFKKKDDVQLIKKVIQEYNHDLKFPPFVLEESNDTIFYKYFDTLNVRRLKLEREYQDNRTIKWSNYE